MWRGHAGQHQSNLLQQCQQVNMDHKYFNPNSGGADCARTFFSFLFLSEKRGLEVLNFWTFPYSLQLLIWFWVSPNHPPSPQATSRLWKYERLSDFYLWYTINHHFLRYERLLCSIRAMAASNVLGWTDQYFVDAGIFLSLIHIWRCRRYAVCRSRWSPYH